MPGEKSGLAGRQREKQWLAKGSNPVIQTLISGLDREASVGARWMASWRQTSGERSVRGKVREGGEDGRGMRDSWKEKIGRKGKGRGGEKRKKRRRKLRGVRELRGKRRVNAHPQPMAHGSGSRGAVRDAMIPFAGLAELTYFCLQGSPG